MASVANVKNIGSTFGNDVEMLRVRYDFAADGGATGALNLFTAASDVVVTAIYAMVKTTVTSGGSATVSVGVTGTANYFVDEIGRAHV